VSTDVLEAAALNRRVIIAKRYGRLANRLVLFAHLIGAAAEHRFTVLNPAFVAQARYFPSTSKTLLCWYPTGRRIPAVPGARYVSYYGVECYAGILGWLQGRGRDVGLIRLRRDQHLDLNSDAFLNVLEAHRVVFVQGWNFRSGLNCERHRAEVCAFFTPWEKHLAAVRAVVDPIRDRDRLLVGTHVRRTDYQRFLDGRFFYSHAQYRSLMESVEAIYPEREVTFVVCSDEPVPSEAFAGLDVVLGPGQELEDLYALAACDLIIGPPSTYTTWASYYGAVPRYKVSDPSAPFGPASFVVDRGLGRRADDEPDGEGS
jgi:hypothetical protein